MKRSNAVTFSARIYKLGINPCVDVPARASRFFGRRGYVPVAGTVGGHSFRGTLVPVGDGRHRLFLNTDIRVRAAVGPGDRVQLVLQLDTRSRDLPVPPALASALKTNHAAAAAWLALTPSKRKEILSYLNWLKSAEAMERNVQNVVERLAGKKGRARNRKN
jgi:hypothetical protein